MRIPQIGDLYFFASGDFVGRAAAAERRANRRLASAIEDFFRDEHDRLDDRARALIGALIEASVTAIERDVGDAAARLLAARGEAQAAKAVVAGNASVFARLIDSGLLRERALMEQLFDGDAVICATQLAHTLGQAR